MSRPEQPGRERLRRRRRRRAVGLARLALLLAAIAVTVVVVGTTVGRGTPPGRTLAEGFARDWAHRDWAGLYADVDAETRASVPYARFAAGYERAWSTATVAHVRVLRPIRLVGGSEVVSLAIATRIFGTLHQQFILPLAGSGSATRIYWHPNLDFPGLYAGETLSRRTTAPARGELLGRDRAPLSEFSSAGDVVGSLGAASGSQLTTLEQDGFPADTQVGLDGLEYIFQSQLAGRPGGRLFAGPRLIAQTRPVAGRDVVTSLDPELEDDAASAFDATGMSGGAIVMIPHSGQILAVAGSPLSQTQPPGSTFKIVTATAVLEAGIAKLDTTFPYGTFALIDGYKLHNSDGEDCGGTLLNAFAVSCNSVYAPLGIRVGAQRLVATAERYGFNEPPTVPGASLSTLPFPDQITNDVALGSTAIGQYQDLASPLQMVRIAATIALGGREPAPTFATGRHAKPRRIVPAAVAHAIRRMMIAVVRQPDGTGVAAQIPGVVVAGKTGTAQITVPACQSSGASGASGVTGVGAVATPTGATGPCADIPNNPYDTDAWFVAFAPAFHPKVAVAILLDHDGAGGTSAAPIARELIADTLALGY
ncbi:MAG TPA: penicillin-binding transpeptidase domain-containing protein [Solirubrobacteraceae bacterium]|nr:penicillin-binding transpeptidase domain-containing protein [Solirubrobacteraceae bacterium]